MAVGRFLPLVFLAVLVYQAAGQEPRSDVCSSPEHHQFDFWIGEWEAVSEQQVAPGPEGWAKGAASSTVRLSLGGCAVEEEFDGSRLPSPIQGRSLSGYDPVADLWRQTWADNEGSYLVFAGKWHDGQMQLTREGPGGDRTRVTYSNITGESFRWVFERSTDGGKNWFAVWKIAYRRKGAPAAPSR